MFYSVTGEKNTSKFSRMRQRKSLEYRSRHYYLFSLGETFPPTRCFVNISGRKLRRRKERRVYPTFITFYMMLWRLITSTFANNFIFTNLKERIKKFWLTFGCIRCWKRPGNIFLIFKINHNIVPADFTYEFELNRVCTNNPKAALI